MLRQFLKEYKLFSIAVVQLANSQVRGRLQLIENVSPPSFATLLQIKRLGFLYASSSPLGADHWTFEEVGGNGGWFGLGKKFFLKPLVFFSV